MFNQKFLINTLKTSKHLEELIHRPHFKSTLYKIIQIKFLNIPYVFEIIYVDTAINERRKSFVMDCSCWDRKYRLEILNLSMLLEVTNSDFILLNLSFFECFFCNKRKYDFFKEDSLAIIDIFE